MNNDLNKNVLQYSEELQKITKDIEQNLLKIQNEKIKEFKNNLNNISNNCISDIRLLINQTHSKINSNLSKNKIDNTVIDEFQLTVQSIILQAKNDLDSYKNQFDLDVSEIANEEIFKLKEFIKENHGNIEEELHNALYQINQSENSALNRLEETYDLGVETIVSAEKTALKNLKVLVEELSLSLESKVEEVEKVIGEKLQNALDKIKEIEDEAIANITKLEITIKNELQVEKDRIIAELEQKIEDFEFTLNGYVDEMKAELTAHKDKLLEDIDSVKEEIIIELEKEKNGIIETIIELEYEIIKNLNSLAQEIIAEIIAVVDGYDLELEIIKTAKIKEFIQAINSLREQCLNEIITITNDCIIELKNVTEKYKDELFCETAQHLISLRNECIALLEDLKAMSEQQKDKIFEKIEAKGQEVIDNLLEYAQEELDKLISNIREQRYITELPEGETVIQLPKDFTLNDRVKLYIDGILLLPDPFFEIDKLNRVITLKNSYEYPTNVFVTADMPDANMQAIKDQLYIDGAKYVQDALNKIEAKGEETLDKFEEELTEKKDELQDKFFEEHKELIDEYVNKYRENVYSVELLPKQTVIKVPASDMVLNRSAKVYFNGVLHILRKHYEIDYLTNSVIVNKQFPYKIDVLILQNLPVMDFPKREATDSEIDDMFAEPYRLGTDEDIDSLNIMKPASDNDVDSLFN